MKGEEMADEMREAIDQIDQIEKYDFAEIEYEEHDKKWGEFSFRFSRNKVVTKQDKKEEAKEFLALGLLEEERTQEAYDKLFSQIAKRMRCWWD
jgi:hypothetical protein